MLQVGGVDCIISQYCQDSNAIEALHTALGIPRENATQHVTNRTRARSCSCHDSCVYLGVCCQDKELTVPTPLQPLVSRSRLADIMCTVPACVDGRGVED